MKQTKIKLPESKISLEDFLNKGEVIPKTIRMNEDIWKNLEQMAEEYGCSLNHLICAILEKSIHDHFRGKEGK